jgi:hypothetical protein
MKPNHRIPDRQMPFPKLLNLTRIIKRLVIVFRILFKKSFPMMQAVHVIYEV